MKAFWTNATEAFIDIASLLLPGVVTFASRELIPARHAFLRRRAQKLEDFDALVYIRATLEDWLSLKHFGKHTSEQS